MDEQHGTGKPHNRRYPPHPLKVEETANTALFVDTDGSVYRKYYDPEYGGGIGRRRIRLGARLVRLRPSVRHAIADAWARQDQMHEHIRQRRELALTSADAILSRSGIDMTADELCSHAGQISGYTLPDGTRLLLRSSTNDGVTPQWRHVTGTADPVDITDDTVAALLNQDHRTRTPGPAPVRTHHPTRRIDHGPQTPGVTG